MKVLAVFACLLAAAAAYGPALIRTPQFDSAYISHERLGGNFAFKSVESPAFAAINPIFQHVPTPVGVSYAARPIIAPVSYTAPAEVHALPYYALPYAPAPLAYKKYY